MRSMSFSDLRGGHININPLPIMDGRLDHGAALDVVTGFAMHEASHSQESRSRFDDLFVKRTARFGTRIEEREEPAFEPMRVAAYLWNLAEDVRIEHVTSTHWPGFEPYFGAVLDYMWDEMRAHHELPTTYGPDLKEKLQVVFLACRYPARVPSDFDGEVAWWQAWQADYLSQRATVKETIQRGLDHLGEDPKTKQELDELAAAERKEREKGERIRAQLERLMREGIEGAYGVCITDEGEVIPLDAETADEVDELVRQQLVEHKTIIKTIGGRSPSIRVRRPPEDKDSKRAFIGKPDPMAQAVRAALVFRASAPQHDLKLLKSGTVDDEEVYRWAIGDERIFSQRVIESKPEVAFGLLVDLSGSMYGQKITIAQRLAQLIVWAIHDQEGVETAVWGHTGDLDASASSEVYRIWEPGDPMSRLGLIATLPHSNNYDGAAISYVVSAMMDKPQPEKVVIVLADGLPAGRGYGGEPAARHIRSVVRWAASRGVRVIQLAIDPYGIDAADQAAMFGEGNWLPFKDVASLPRQLGSIMEKFL